MEVHTFEGVVTNGQIELPSDVQLPEQTKVYVVVPNMTIGPIVKVVSPRLKNPNQAKEFEMEIIEESANA
ncbi:MAG: hypothetical protein ACRD63_07635 [Pyrinomonadaceae bacterium]